MDPVQAPADTIQWLRQTLDNHEVEYLTFFDYESDIRLIICKDTPRMRARISNPSVGEKGARHLLPDYIIPRLPPTGIVSTPLPVVSSPEYLGEVNERDLAALEGPLRAPTPPPAEPSPIMGPLNYTTTSHNRRKITQRLQKLANKKARKEKKQLSRRRVSRSSSPASESVGSPRESLVPSSAAAPSLEALWFQEASAAIGEPNLQLSPTEQSLILKNARSIAGPEAVQDWQEILVSWREEQQLRLYSRPSSSTAVESPTAHLDGQPKEVCTFYYSYKKVARSVLAAKFNSIAERVNLANLHDAYTQAESAVPNQPLRSGQTQAALKKQYLFAILHPDCPHTSNPAADPRYKSKWAQLSIQLRFASRWFYLREQLGFGVLGLIPTDLVSNHWVHNQLPKAQFTLWVRAIKHFNPKCIPAGEELGTMLQRALRGARPSRRRRTLEDVPATGLTADLDPVVLFGVSSDGVLTSGDEIEEPASPSQEMDFGETVPFSVGQLDYIWDDRGNFQPVIPWEYQTMNALTLHQQRIDFDPMLSFDEY
jgi:hypothetical protein